MFKSQPAQDRQQASIGPIVGYGGLGCAAGVLLGLVGGGLLLGLIALIAALSTPVTPPTSVANPSPDLRLSFSENFLNQVVQSEMDGTGRVDILPDNRFNLILDTELSALGTVLPVQITGLFGVELTNQILEIQLIDTQIVGLTLSPELTDFFSADLPRVNQEVNEALQEISTSLGRPIILTGLGTTETELWFEGRETP